MTPQNNARAISAGTSSSLRSSAAKELLTTKEVSRFTGFSTSYFEKGRTYGYGPAFVQIIRPGNKTGKVLYRLETVEAWLKAQEREPGGISRGQ